MANKDDYLTEYRCFFENFAQTVNPNDQLPVKLGSYKLLNVEVVGGIIDWTTQYLTQKGCPLPLISPLIKIIIEESRKLCKKQPVACGFNTVDNAYEPLKLMQTVMAKTNEICLRYLDNSTLCSLPTPGPSYNPISVCAVKNNRRRMEDRHVVIHDLNSLFIEQEASPSSYYAIFDGHAGHDAAVYCSAHLHQFLAESHDFISNPEQALRDAFLKTDSLFIDKCKVESFSGGTTAVCALHRHKEKTLYIAWAGDSQALLVSQGKIKQCVEPHKPSREDEKNRIEAEGGCVMFWGTWRVNGQLAVSRAIGDHEYKPYVTAEPDIMEIALNGTEDFLILACDGLWDFMSESDAARCVYEEISNKPDDIENVSATLVQVAKKQGSSDNISVIVVFLREPSKIAAEAHWATRNNLIMDTIDNANTTNPFANSNSSDILSQKEGFVLNLAESFKQNGSDKSSSNEFLCKATNGKIIAEEFDDDDDMGPETDVDAIDDVLLSPAIAAAKLMADSNLNNNANAFDPFCNIKEEKATLELDSEVEKQQIGDTNPFALPRDETPTPPVDSVHDNSGLLDNVAESGEDSDDEWNYFKGGAAADKENVAPSQAEQEALDKDDSMSQLNPDAQEFVPVSPSRPVISPAFQTLIDDSVISQSPRRPTADVDIKVPNIRDFNLEIKNRPSDVCTTNGSGDESSQKLSSQEIMENLLNGKTMDEIEFQPITTPTKVHKASEFHFGSNNDTPCKLLDQSEALSTKAVFGDESAASYLDDKFLDETIESNQVLAQPLGEDPMSQSFYQNENGDNNPFDLNKIHVLPENIEDFLSKPLETSFNETISDLPEHNPLEDIAEEQKYENNVDTEHRLIVDIESALETQSTVSNTNEPSLPILEPEITPISPIPASSSPVPLAESPAPIPPTQSPIPPAQSPIPSAQSPIPPAQSPIPPAQSPIPPTQSPIPPVQSPDLLAQSPIPSARSPFELAQSPTPRSPSPIPLAQSPVPVPQSPVALTQSPVPPVDLPSATLSPLPPSNFPSILSETSTSPKLLSPTEDLTSSAKDSPVNSPLINTQFEQDFCTLNYAQQVSDAVVETIKPEKEPENTLIPDLCAFNSPKSVEDFIDTESVATTDLNSFLERSALPDVTSPLSENAFDNSQILNPEMQPHIDLEIKSELIQPEYPIHSIAATPSEESKIDEIVSKVEPLVDVVAPNVTEQSELLVGVVAPTVVEKKPLATKTKVGATGTAAKKSLTKPTSASPSATTKTTKAPLTKTAAKPTTTLSPKPAPITKPKPKPTGIASKTIEKKSTTDEAKPATLTRKPLSATTKPIPRTVPSKLSPTKPTETKILNGTAKSAAPTSRPLPSKPLGSARPTTLTSKTSVGRTSTATATKTAVKSTTLTSPKVPTTTTARSTMSATTAKSTLPSTTSRTKPLTSRLPPKAPDAEKQIKETTNKQITAASRANQAISSTRTTVTNVRKTDVKAPAMRTTVTKTSTTTVKASANNAKKPAELVRHPIKGKVGAIKKPTPIVENKNATEIISSESIKEVEPITEINKCDNSQIENVAVTATD